MFKPRYYNFKVTYKTKSGFTKTKTVLARHENEAIQLAGAFNRVVLSVVNLDL